jgi:hypothetical protein
MLQEKIESSSKLSRLQRDYDKAEEECQKYRTLYENLKQEVNRMLAITSVTVTFQCVAFTASD